MAKFGEKEVLEKIASTRLLPLFNFADLEVCKSVISACYDAGIRAFELTNRDEHALNVFSKLVQFVAAELPELSMGAGTILDAETAQKFIDAGADYIIAPNLDFKVGEQCAKNNIPWIPGCFTPTEFQQAHLAGSPLIKLFPGGIPGPDYLKQILAPLPHLKIVVTGGVQMGGDSIKNWMKAGAFAVGVGSQLFSKDVIRSGSYSTVTEKLRQVISGLAAE